MQDFRLYWTEIFIMSSFVGNNSSFLPGPGRGGYFSTSGLRGCAPEKALFFKNLHPIGWGLTGPESTHKGRV